MAPQARAGLPSHAAQQVVAAIVGVQWGRDGIATHIRYLVWEKLSQEGNIPTKKKCLRVM
jgi:hypothetical protein